MPSKPNPLNSERGVATTAASGNPAADVMVKLFGFGALPGGGPVICQPPSSPFSKEVVPWPVDTSMSSTKTPSPWVAQSLMYAIETSAWPPAYADRSTDHCCQPAELPESAHHSPVVPVGVQVVVAVSSVW